VAALSVAVDQPEVPPLAGGFTHPPKYATGDAPAAVVFNAANSEPPDNTATVTTPDDCNLAAGRIRPMTEPPVTTSSNAIFMLARDDVGTAVHCTHVESDESARYASADPNATTVPLL
jgi:hypothetical protein